MIQLFLFIHLCAELPLVLCVLMYTSGPLFVEVARFSSTNVSVS